LKTVSAFANYGNGKLSRKDIDLKTGYEKSKNLRILNGLVEKSIIRKSGSGPAVTYMLK
jgi:ATP-dependent DNA helicase RecG